MLRRKMQTLKPVTSLEKAESPKGEERKAIALWLKIKPNILHQKWKKMRLYNSKQ